MSVLSVGGRALTSGGRRLSSTAVAPDYRFGMLALGSTRSKYLWPFNSTTSPWNVPIGSSAMLSAAGITFIESGTNSGGYPTRVRGERERIFMDTAAASQTMKFNCYGWSGEPGCTEVNRRTASTGGTFSGSPYFANFTVQASDSFLVDSTTENNCAAFVTADGVNVDQVEPYEHWASGGDFTAQQKFSRVSITGSGESGSHGGSNLSALGGTIRYGEITNAFSHGLSYLSHTLKVNLDAHRFYYYAHTPGWVWPATIRDGYASAVTYGGSNANLVPGALLTLQSSFNTAAGGGNVTTALGSLLAETIKRFGMYCVDDTTFNGVYLAVEEGPAGSVTTELTGLGYTLDYDAPTLATGNAFYQDLRNIFAGLYIVTNNGSGAIGGGGSTTYATPNAPAFGN